MSNYDIIDYLKNKSYFDKFKGIIVVKDLHKEKPLNNKEFYILFLTNDYSSIGHWQLLIKINNNDYIMFSSEGQKPNINTIKFAKKIKDEFEI